MVGLGTTPTSNRKKHPMSWFKNASQPANVPSNNDHLVLARRILAENRAIEAAALKAAQVAAKK